MGRRPAGWSDREDLLKQVEKIWDSGRLLRERLEDSGYFPRRLVFRTPGTTALTHEFEAVRSWAAQVERLRGFRIEWKTIRHRVIGENRLPVEAWIDDLEGAVDLLGKASELEQFDELVRDTQARVPRLRAWIFRHPLKSLSCAPSWSRFLDFVVWRKTRDRPGIYLRQVDIPGVDTKFIERHRAVLGALLDEVLPAAQVDASATGVRQFERRYGFRSRPHRVRYRLLDPALAVLPGRDRDISVTGADFGALFEAPGVSSSLDQVFITENEINFLAFPDRPRSLVVFGGGYGFEALAKADWLDEVALLYWGDIDTHGFAILDQLRARFPHASSLLMDESTLFSHRDFWEMEVAPEVRPLNRLTEKDRRLYQALCKNQYAHHLRLEQERVRYGALESALASLGQQRVSFLSGSESGFE
jgi:hypothetical protein